MLGEHGCRNYRSSDNSIRDGAIPTSHKNNAYQAHHLGRMQFTGVIFTHVKISHENLIQRLPLRQPLTRKPFGGVAQARQKTINMDNPVAIDVTGHTRTENAGFVSLRMLVLCHLECCSAKSNVNTKYVAYLPPQSAIHSSISSAKRLHKPFSMSLLSTVLLHGKGQRVNPPTRPAYQITDCRDKIQRRRYIRWPTIRPFTVGVRSSTPVFIHT
jgi:hypothetical protein